MICSDEEAHKNVTEIEGGGIRKCVLFRDPIHALGIPYPYSNKEVLKYPLYY